MGRKSKAKFEMKGHTLPGINQKFETVNLKDGRSPSSAFQMQQSGDSPLQKGFWKKALNVATGGLAGGIGKAMKGDWKGALGSVASGGVSSFLPGGGGGGGAAAARAAGSAKSMGGGGEEEDAAAGAELLKAEAKEAMQG